MLRTVAVISAAIGAIGLTTASWAEPGPARATEFSSQQQKKRGGPAHTAPRVNVGRPATVNRNINRSTNVNRNVNRNTNINVNRNTNIQRIGRPGFKPQVIGGAKVAPLKLGPGKAGPVVFKQANFPVVKLGGNKIAPIWKVGPKKLYWSGRWRTFVPLAALGAVVIGGSYYYADSYLTVARPYCEGISPDGCRLNWQRVNFEDGESEWQCVQYCARPGAPPPARTVALAAPPPAQQGACELSIFSEPNYGGTNATSADEQPRLAELGWANQVASIKVMSGTWDFFTEPDFTGEVIRFAPGDYPDLGPDWGRKAASFMCVQP